MERGREVLVGKLAIGRRVLTRADAVRCFHATSGEPFWELAVREGLLDRSAADDLVKTIDEGSLVCRGSCGAELPLDSANPPQDARCPMCGGPLYIRSKDAATRETWKDKGSEALREAVAEGKALAVSAPNGPSIPLPAAQPAPTPSERPRPKKKTGTEPLYTPPRLDPRLIAETIPPPQHGKTDSLPSAIPIKKTALSAPIPEETKDDEPPQPPSLGFRPFTIGTCEVLAPIGKGGMGSVFRARHRALNQMVAIKVFTSHVAEDEEQRKRFDREVKTMAKLEHPGIVRVKGGGVITEKGPFEGRPYYIMEYVEGRDLALWMRERPRTVGECARMIAKICEIVDFFHNRTPWVVHRDLKPQNVIVASDSDFPKICDFGLAKVEDSKLTRTGDIMGTPQFMPPEQALGRGSRIGPPTDVYSLGGILYFLLTGEAPFDFAKDLKGNSGLINLMTRIERQPPPKARDKNLKVTPALEAIVQKCLEKDPKNRFPFARDLGKALVGLNLPA